MVPAHPTLEILQGFSLEEVFRMTAERALVTSHSENSSSKGRYRRISITLPAHSSFEILQGFRFGGFFRMTAERAPRAIILKCPLRGHPLKSLP